MKKPNQNMLEIKVPCFGFQCFVYMFRHAMHEHDRLLVREELAEWLRISPQTISNRLSRGADLPPSIKIGSARRWFVKDVMKWLEERVESTVLEILK